MSPWIDELPNIANATAWLWYKNKQSNACLIQAIFYGYKCLITLLAIIVNGEQ